MKKIFYIALIATLFTACESQPYAVKSMSGVYIPVTKATNPDPKMVEFVDSYKTVLDKEMGKVIGYSAQNMVTGRPESMLTNLTSDWMIELNRSYTENRPVDLAFMNVHGIRAPIAQGDITLGDIFTAYPFDNSLAVVRLKGEYLTEVFESYAKMGGAGLSKNVKLVVKNKKLVSATINGRAVDKNKIYTIVTLDYLAEGNDGMDSMAKAEKSTLTGILLRDYMLDKVREHGKNNKPIVAKLDGRITITE